MDNIINMTEKSIDRTLRNEKLKNRSKRQLENRLVLMKSGNF